MKKIYRTANFKKRPVLGGLASLLFGIGGLFYAEWIAAPTILCIAISTVRFLTHCSVMVFVPFYIALNVTCMFLVKPRVEEINKPVENGELPEPKSRVFIACVVVSCLFSGPDGLFSIKVRHGLMGTALYNAFLRASGYSSTFANGIYEILLLNFVCAILAYLDIRKYNSRIAEIKSIGERAAPKP